MSINNQGQWNPWGNNTNLGPTGPAANTFAEAKQGVLNGDFNGDPGLKQTLDQYDNQLQQLGIQRQFTGMKALNTIGDLQQKIFNNRMQASQNEADQGVGQGGAQIIAQKQLNNQINQSQQQFEQGYLNNLQNINTQALLTQTSEDAALKGTNAIKQALAKELAANSQYLNQGSPTSNWFSNFFKELVHYVPETSQGINWDKAKNDKNIQNWFNQLGLDVNDTTSQNVIDKFVNKYTTHGGFWLPAGYGGKIDPFRPIWTYGKKWTK